MKKLEELMEGLQSHYSRFKDDPSRIEIDLFKEKLRKSYDIVCEVERGKAEGHPAEGGEKREEKREESLPAGRQEEKREMEENGEVRDESRKVEVQSAEEGIQNAEVIEELIKEEKSNIEHRTSNIEIGTTLADKFMNAADRTLAAKIKKQHIQDLKTAIGLNDKFNFIKELFNNDVLKYNETVDQLNLAGSREKAESHLAALKEKYRWADEMEPYLKLSEYVDKKYF